jgi:aryl-alcohol dehydrogenase
LGCGIQTGAGAILKSLDCRQGSSVLITGGGSVGQSAVMAAAIRGCNPIIVSEPNAGRRALALELGATHVIDPASESLAESVSAIAPHGIDYAVDTSGRVDVIETALALLAISGVVCLVGIPEGEVKALTIPVRSLMSGGKTIRGTVEGDSNPQEFIPELIGYYREGRLPLEKLVSFYAFADINQAFADQKAGLCVKPVLLLGNA